MTNLLSKLFPFLNKKSKEVKVDTKLQEEIKKVLFTPVVNNSVTVEQPNVITQTTPTSDVKTEEKVVKVKKTTSKKIEGGTTKTNLKKPSDTPKPKSPTGQKKKVKTETTDVVKKQRKTKKSE